MARTIQLLALLCLVHGAALAAEDILKSPNDLRQYQALTLANGIKVLLVSDPNTELAAAALDVNVGYFSDPADRPGLAHFLEHMLFLGTKKYPDPASFRGFMSAHGGHLNAYTAAEHTVFYFDVDRKYVPEALDRFAQFFVAPLFDQRYVQQEMQAVDSEYRLRIRDDSRRLTEVLKETVNPAHPFAKFSVGNVETLRDREDDPARAAVMTFYERHYSANLMTLAVISAEPLSRMKRLVGERFGAVPNRRAAPLSVSVPVLSPDQAATRIDAIPLRDKRQLRLEFPFPWNDAYRLSKPALLIEYVIGHEGRGSLYDLLKRRGWIDQLSAESSRLASNEGVFDISMDLTSDGATHIDDVLMATFGYLNLVRREGVGPRIHAEIEHINRLEFEYQEKGSTLSEATAFAENLQLYPRRLALAGPLYLGAYDSRAVANVLDRLRPDNARVVVMAPDLQTTATSRYYGTPYGAQKIADATLERWAHAEPDPALAMPQPNRFVPTSTRLKPLDAKVTSTKPVRLIAEPGLRLWHLQDREFRVPKADLYVTLETPRAADSPRAAAMTTLYLALVRDNLDADTYPAEVAGLDYHLYRPLRGLGFSVSGYDEKQPLLTDMIVEGLLEPEIDPLAFEVRRQELIRQWDNSRLNSPYTRVYGELDDLLYFNRWPAAQLSAALATVSIDDLKAFIGRLISEFDLEVFIHGNVTSAEAQALAHQIAVRVFAHAKPGPAVAREVTRLGPGRRYLRSLDATHEDTAVLAYYQAADDSITTTASFLMLEQIVKSPFFDTLRTEEQFGYVVSAQSNSALRVPGLNFLVQSPARGPNVIAARIDRFIAEFRARLAGMTDADFAGYKQGLLTMLREKDTSLEHRSLRLQSDLALGAYDFDRRDRLIDAVTQLQKQDLLAVYDDSLLSNDSRRLIIQATGNGHGEEALDARNGFSAITDITAFKEETPGFKLGE